MPDTVAVTVYDRTGVALAWVGRPSDVGVSERLIRPLGLFRRPPRRSDSGSSTFCRFSPPISAASARSPPSTCCRPRRRRQPFRRVGTCSRRRSGRPRCGRGGKAPAIDRAKTRFCSTHPAASRSSRSRCRRPMLSSARRAWRRRVVASVLVIIAITGPPADRTGARSPRRGDDGARVSRGRRAGRSLLLAAAFVIVGVALAIELGRRPPPSALLLVGGADVATAIALLAGPVRAVAHRTARAPAEHGSIADDFPGAAAACRCRGRDHSRHVRARCCRASSIPSTVDLRHFSLHPWNVARLALLTGILACHSAALWTCTLILSAALARWRIGPSPGLRIRILLIWIAPSVAMAAFATFREWTLPALGLVLSASACAVAALSAIATGRVVSPHDRRRADPGVVRGVSPAGASAVPVGRLLRRRGDANAHRVAVRGPGAAVLPDAAGTLDRSARRNRRGAAHTRERRSARLRGASRAPEDSRQRNERRRRARLFRVESNRARARASDVGGRALQRGRRAASADSHWNLPEYSGTAQAPQIEALRRANGTSSAKPPRSAPTSAACCTRRGRSAPPPRPMRRRRPVGTIVVHVLVFDYRTLPFITSQNPYFEVFRPTQGGAPREGTTGSEVEVAIYGWSLAAVYNSPHAAWSIGDDLFARIYDPARRPFWTTVQTSDGRYRVFFSNDRVFIYAIGYRTLTPLRSSRPPRRVDDAVGCVLRAGARSARPASRAWRARVRVWAARCCARFARASIGSCFSRSCWRRSFRC